MTSSKYGNLLTVILIILVIAVLTIIGILFYNYVIKPDLDRKEKIEEFERFQEEIEEEPEEAPQEGDMESTTKDDEEYTSYNVRQKPTYKGFARIGFIKISKTNVNQPILDELNDEALNTAVVSIYPSNPQLNEPGNVVIIGHNYRDGKFFADNKKLNVGDKIQIIDNSGREKTYTIYSKFETTPEDASFYNRDTNGVPEITLSCCTDKGDKRIILLAKAE